MNIRRLTLFLMLAVLCVAGTEQASAFYNPGTGRWLSKDPIAENGGINLYGFVANNPVNRWDLLGKQIGYAAQEAELIAQLAESGATAQQISETLGISISAATSIIAAQQIEKASESLVKVFTDTAKGKDPCQKLQNAVKSAQKGVDRINKIIAEHQGYVNDPNSYPNLDPAEVAQQGGIQNVVQTWQKQIEKQQKQLAATERALEKLKAAASKACFCWYDPRTWFQ